MGLVNNDESVRVFRVVQVAVANRAFSPSLDELAWAARVVEAYEEAERRGEGAVGLDGAMVDRPIYVRALDLLARGRAVS